MDRVLGEYCAKHNLRYYQRLRRAYKKMDDWVILCKTRNQLRYAVRLMNQQLDLVKQTKHPLTLNKEQTYIGRIKHDGFDLLLRASCPPPFGPAQRFKMVPDHFVGYRIAPKPRIALHLSKKSVTRWLTWIRGGVTIDLKQVIQEGLSSQLAQGIGDSRWLAELYGRVVAKDT